MWQTDGRFGKMVCSLNSLITAVCKMPIVCASVVFNTKFLKSRNCRINIDVLSIYLNRHETILYTFLNFFLNLTLSGVPHFYKQIPNGQYFSDLDLGKMCNFEANLWKMWIGDHRFLTYIFKWERPNTAAIPTLSPSATEWPHYITTN